MSIQDEKVAIFCSFVVTVFLENCFTLFVLKNDIKMTCKFFEDRRDNTGMVVRC